MAASGEHAVRDRVWSALDQLENLLEVLGGDVVAVSSPAPGQRGEATAEKVDGRLGAGS